MSSITLNELVGISPGANKMYRHMSKSRASILQSGGKTESEGAALKSSRNKKE